MTSPLNNDPNYDPLAQFDKTPAVSFDPNNGGTPENTWVKLNVTDYIKLLQAKDDNGKPKFYEDSGKPVIKAVLAVEQDGEARALWTKKNWVQGGLFRSLAEAQTELGSRIGPGVELYVRWHWDTTKPKKLGNHPKAYEAKAKLGTAPAPAEDPLATPAGPPPAVTTPADTSPWAGGDEPPF